MKYTPPRSTSALADSKLFLGAVILSLLAAVLGIILADANVALATLQVLPTRLPRETTDRVVTDTWTDTKVKEIAAKFKSARNAGPSTFVATAK
jgi:hypothetical protein